MMCQGFNVNISGEPPALILRLLSTDDVRVRNAVAGALVAEFGTTIWIKPERTCFKEWRFSLTPQDKQPLATLNRKVVQFLEEQGLHEIFILS